MERIVPVATPILRDMENSDEIFTLVYSKGNLLISPRKQTNCPRSIGGGCSAHLFFKKDKSDIYLAKDSVPLKGHFTWERFIH